MNVKNSLKVPFVFFSTFLSSLIIISVVTGIALFFSYETAGINRFKVFFSLFLQVSYRCSIFALVFSIAGVYLFLMRHIHKKNVSILLFILCLGITVCALMPFLYAQGASIDETVQSFHLGQQSNTDLMNFIVLPESLNCILFEGRVLIDDIIVVYEGGYQNYLLFIMPIVLLVCTSWVCCISSAWTLLNMIFLFAVLRVMLLGYWYVHLEPVSTFIIKNLPFGIDSQWISSLLALSVAIIMTLYAMALLLVRSVKQKKLRRKV